MKKNFAFYLLELVIVFVGVFSAFLLNDRQQQKAREEVRIEIYMALYEDLNRFYEAGRSDNPEGFIQMFSGLSTALDSAIVSKSLPSVLTLYGDYYNIEITSSLLKSGVLSEVDIHTFKEISRFHSQHQNMLSYIDKFNDYYLNKVTASFDNPESIYRDNPTRLKPSYQPIMSYLDIIIGNAEILVASAQKRKEHIKENYLVDEF